MWGYGLFIKERRGAVNGVLTSSNATRYNLSIEDLKRKHSALFMPRTYPPLLSYEGRTPCDTGGDKQAGLRLKFPNNFIRIRTRSFFIIDWQGGYSRNK
jgi:hypothetical protein